MGQFSLSTWGWDQPLHVGSQVVQEKAHTSTLAPSLYSGEGSQLGTSLLAPVRSSECKTTFLLLCGLAWKTLPLQTATLCYLSGCCSGFGELSSEAGRDLWRSAGKSCLPALSSLVQKKQNTHHRTACFVWDCGCSSFPPEGYA